MYFITLLTSQILLPLKLSIARYTLPVVVEKRDGFQPSLKYVSLEHRSEEIKETFELICKKFSNGSINILS